jgi:hypothetical protein
LLLLAASCHASRFTIVMDGLFGRVMLTGFWAAFFSHSPGLLVN